MIMGAMRWGLSDLTGVNSRGRVELWVLCKHEFGSGYNLCGGDEKDLEDTQGKQLRCEGQGQ